MVKQSAPDWLRDYAGENRLFHCTEVSVLYLVVSDAYTKGLPSGAVLKIRKVSQLKRPILICDFVVRHHGAQQRRPRACPVAATSRYLAGEGATGSSPSGDQVSQRRFDPKNATLPSQPPDLRFWTPPIAEDRASSSSSTEQHESRRRHVARPRSMER